MAYKVAFTNLHYEALPRCSGRDIGGVAISIGRGRMILFDLFFAGVAV